MKRGWTMLEIIVVISIIALMAALSLPVFAAVKEKAKESSCLSKLHQLQLATALYRESSDHAEFGTPSQMGLPPDIVTLRIWSKMPKDSLLCANRGSSKSPNVYLVLAPLRGSNEDLMNDWVSATSLLGDQIPIYGDLNHGPNMHETSPFFVQHAIGVRLNGSLFIRNKSGYARNFDWWVEGEQ